MKIDESKTAGSFSSGFFSTIAKKIRCIDTPRVCAVENSAKDEALSSIKENLAKNGKAFNVSHLEFINKFQYSHHFNDLTYFFINRPNYASVNIFTKKRVEYGIFYERGSWGLPKKILRVKDPETALTEVYKASAMLSSFEKNLFSLMRQENFLDKNEYLEHASAIFTSAFASLGYRFAHELYWFGRVEAHEFINEALAQWGPRVLKKRALHEPVAFNDKSNTISQVSDDDLVNFFKQEIGSKLSEIKFWNFDSNEPSATAIGAMVALPAKAIILATVEAGLDKYQTDRLIEAATNVAAHGLAYESKIVPHKWEFPWGNYTDSAWRHDMLEGFNFTIDKPNIYHPIGCIFAPQDQVSYYLVRIVTMLAMTVFYRTAIDALSLLNPVLTARALEI